MKTIKSRFACAVALIGVGALVVVGCAMEAPVDSMGVASDEASPDTETLTMSLDNGVAHGAKLSSQLVRVDIYDLQGVPQFSVDFRLGGADEETIRWTMLGAPGTAPASQGMNQAFDQLPDLHSAIAGAAYMQTAVTTAMANGEEYDHYGCDIPTWTGISSCGSKGKCCDVHDACYARNGCTSASWYSSQGAACASCNSAVVFCILGTNPGPSSCCATGNCGQPR